jgi:hypothetical protein
VKETSELAIPRKMEAIRLHSPGLSGLRHETVDTPSLDVGDALVEVHAAAITRDELEWPLDRLPTFALSDAAAAFERSLASGKGGKVVIRVAPEGE